MEMVPEEPILAINRTKLNLATKKGLAQGPCCNKATVLMARELYFAQITESLSLSSILLKDFSIKSVQFASPDEEAEQIIDEFVASMDKKCCNRRFKVVITDANDHETEFYERLMQEQLILRAHECSSHAQQSSVLMLSAKNRIVSKKQLEQIIKHHN